VGLGSIIAQDTSSGGKESILGGRLSKTEKWRMFWRRRSYWRESGIERPNKLGNCRGKGEHQGLNANRGEHRLGRKKQGMGEVLWNGTKQSVKPPGTDEEKNSYEVGGGLQSKKQNMLKLH